MARNLISGSGHYLTLASALVTTEPLSIACFFRASDLSANQNIVSLVNNATNAAHYLTCRGALAGDPAGAQSFAGTGGVEAALSSGSIMNGVWHHIGGVWPSSSARAVFLDGAKNTNSGSVTVSGVNETNVGRFVSTTSATADGDIAEIGFWNVALTDDEMLSLARGISPLLVRPQSLVDYFPLIGSGSPETGVKGNALTVSVATKVAHPRIYR
jgi:hypothetical protein